MGAAIGYVTVVGILLSLVIGAPALRLRGLFLTVTTLGFAVAASSYLLNLSIFQSSDLQVSEVTPGRLGPINFGSYRLDYYVCVICLVGIIFIAKRVRATGIGRTMIAVEGNEDSVAAMTVSPAAVKLSAFAIAGGIATFAGGLFALVSRTFDASSFTPDQSLQVLAMTVVGGIGSVAGAVVGAIYLIGIADLFGNSLTAQLATSGIGLLIILRLQPGGLVAVWHSLRDWGVNRLLPSVASPDADNKSEIAEDAHDPRNLSVQLSNRNPAAVGVPSSEEVESVETPALLTSSLSVNLGGRSIVSEVDLVVNRDEVVGLIGSNGAGKSTLMNAIGGFVSSSGEIWLHDVPISHMSAVGRARMGLGRTFQAATLYPRLSIRECVQVARRVAATIGNRPFNLGASAVHSN